MDLPSQLPHLGSSPANWLVQVSLDAVSCLPTPASLLQSGCAPPTYQLCPGKANLSLETYSFSLRAGGWEMRGNATEAEQLATLLSLYRVFSSDYNGYLLFPLSALIGQIYNII